MLCQVDSSHRRKKNHNRIIMVLSIFKQKSVTNAQNKGLKCFWIDYSKSSKIFQYYFNVGQYKGIA